MSDAALPAPTADEALHTTVDIPFEDAVPFVLLEHELAIPRRSLAISSYCSEHITIR